MSTKLFVGSLSWDTTDQSLGDYFAQAGTVVSAKVVTDRDTGRSRGFGFVEMSNEQEAEEAMKLTGPLDGRTIVVNEAKPQTESRGDRGDRGGSGGRGGYGGGGNRGFRRDNRR